MFKVQRYVCACTAQVCCIAPERARARFGRQHVPRCVVQGRAQQQT